jgi:hypothetical protein
LNRLRDFLSVAALFAHRRAPVDSIANGRKVGYTANTKEARSAPRIRQRYPSGAATGKKKDIARREVMMGIQRGASPTRLLEMLSDRFGAFEAIANSSIKLARVAPEEELAMDKLVAEAVLEFADDLRAAKEAVAG